jgi:hypothetical protein
VSTFEWLLQGALLVLLLALLPIGWRLERRLAALRREGAGLSQGAEGLAAATEAAEAALARLRATAEGSARMVTERSAAAERLRDDLAFLIERAEMLADRLDGLVREARPQAAGAAPAAATATSPGPRSEAERELLRALKGLR